MASEEDERLAKVQQDKIDKEKFETELAEAGITVPSEDAPVTMKAMIELLGFMKTKMVEDVFTKVVSQTAASSSNDSAAESLVDKLKAKSSEKPPLNFAPPSSYLTQTTPVQPHINNQSRPPPKLDSTRYFSWKKSMESYFRSCSVHLWRVVLQGYNPVDPNNLTRQEEIDEQLDANAKFILESAMSANDEDIVRNLKTTKEAWVHLQTIYEGNEGIQRCDVVVLPHEVDNFVMLEDESPTDVFRRLTKLTVTMRENGKKDMDDEWVKAKLLKTLVPYNEKMVMNLHARADYTTMSSNDILAQFVIYDTLKATSKSSINQTRVTKNLALKAFFVLAGSAASGN